MKLKEKKIMSLLIFSITIIIFSQLVNSIPPMPTEFFGRVIDYNFNATPGGVITIYDSGSNVCGTFTIQNAGLYGTLTCNGDDPETGVDEGAITGENITFRYNSQFVTLDGDSIWEQGVFKQVNLTFPVVFCGDNFCDALHENSFTCLIDCPNQTSVPNGTNSSTNVNLTANSTTFNTTASNASSSGGGSTGTSSSSAGTSSSTPRQVRSNFIFNITTDATGSSGLECNENWTCRDWSECTIDGFQNRTCKDLNVCGTFELKPADSQKCTYTPTCSDKIKNGLEEGVDCGGLCKPCISCFDGVQNCHDGYCEEDVDCGGGCNACNSCFDGIKNCHGGSCETGLDCGPICNNICPEEQKPQPIFVCKKDINPINNQFIIFFTIVAFSILFEVSYTIPKIRELRRSKTQKGIERARKIRSLKTRMYLFITIILFIAIIIYLYYYMFVLCQSDYKYALWLIFLLLLLPFVIHTIIKSVEYNEKKKEAKLKALLEAHENQIKLMIKIENEVYVDKFNTINQAIKKNKEKLDQDLSKSSSESVSKLLETYSKQEVDLLEVEKEETNTLNALTALINSEQFKTESVNDENLSDLTLKINEVTGKQEDKKKLYDELKKIKSGQNTYPEPTASNIEPEKK